MMRNKMLGITSIILASAVLQCKSTQESSSEVAAAETASSTACPAATQLAKPELSKNQKNIKLYTWSNSPIAASDPRSFVAATAAPGRTFARNQQELCPYISPGARFNPQEIYQVLSYLGLQGGDGLYLASDPAVSMQYGRILLEIEIPPDVEFGIGDGAKPDGITDWIAYARLLANKGAPIISYAWQTGAFESSRAFVLRDAGIAKNWKVRTVIDDRNAPVVGFADLPSFSAEMSSIKGQDKGEILFQLLSKVSHLGRLFTTSMAKGFGSNDSSFVADAILAELESGAHRQSGWFNTLVAAKACDSKVNGGDMEHDCAWAIHTFMVGAPTKVTPKLAADALKLAFGFSYQNVSDSKTFVSQTVAQYQKTKGYTNAKEWLEGLKSLVKATYAENQRYVVAIGQQP